MDKNKRDGNYSTDGIEFSIITVFGVIAVMVIIVFSLYAIGIDFGFLFKV